MPTGLFNKLIYTAKKIAFNLKEKQKMTIDDLVLEHMLFYHDLAGSNLESNKETRIVKADIKEALKRENAGELSLAIKLPPTLWEEQIKSIISELDENQQQVMARLILAPVKDSSEFDKKSLVLSHEDWRVRANAANILAFLKVKEAVPALTESLNCDTTDSALSFCYVAYALGKLQGSEAKGVLEKQLTNENAWLRVDAAGALSYFAFSDIAEQLANALMQEQEALDYMAYAISCRLRPAKFLQTNSKQVIKGGCRLIFGIIAATKSGFSSNLIIETESHLCMPYLVRFAQELIDPVVVDTTLSLSEYLSEEQEGSLKRIANDSGLSKNVIEIIENVTNNPSKKRDADFIHALRLVAKLDIWQAQSKLVRLINEFSSDLKANELKNVIISLSKISKNKQQSAAVLISFAKKLVNVEDRRQFNKRKQPVFEESAEQTKTYWEILKALGNLVTDEAISFLLHTLNDYAPDMRSRALESIIEIYEKDPGIYLAKPIDQILQVSLKDSSPMVQLAALLGAAKLGQAALINDIIPLIDAQENTVSKQALNSLADIAKNGHEADVKALLKEKIKTIKTDYKRKHISDILQKY